MIRYRVELYCNGCIEFLPTFRFIADDGYGDLGEEFRERRAELVRIAHGEGWVTLDRAHFCPRCQVQRREPSEVVWRRGEHAT